MVLKKILISGGTLLIFLFLFFSSDGRSQDRIINKDRYQIGPDEKLMITVHIFGEVKNPGEYIVADDTNLLELISKAGGPTEYSNLSDVKITRGLIGYSELKKALKKQTNQKFYKARLLKKQVVRINLKKMLDKEKYRTALPNLQPGDVVRVGKNAWFAWQTVIRVISQLAIVAQVWYWYSRVG